MEILRWNHGFNVHSSLFNLLDKTMMGRELDSLFTFCTQQSYQGLLVLSSTFFNRSTVSSLTDFSFHIFRPNNDIKAHLFYPKQFLTIQPCQFSLPPSLTFLDKTTILRFTDSIVHISGWNHHFNVHSTLFTLWTKQW